MQDNDQGKYLHCGNREDKYDIMAYQNAKGKSHSLAY